MEEKRILRIKQQVVIDKILHHTTKNVNPNRLQLERKSVKEVLGLQPGPHSHSP